MGCELLHTGTGLSARGTTLLAGAHVGLDHLLVLLAMTGRTRPDLLGTSAVGLVLFSRKLRGDGPVSACPFIVAALRPVLTIDSRTRRITTKGYGAFHVLGAWGPSPPLTQIGQVVVGSTASGKSANALDLVARLSGAGTPAEIMCIDSMTVYRGMDIGTAKPSAADQAAVPHHLIDLVDPDQEFSVAEFQRQARIVLADLDARGVVPVLVGGTGMYVDVVVDDFTLPGQFPDVRAVLQNEELPDLYARLVMLDPAAANRMEPSNERRIIRALEVCIGSGRPFSSFGPGLQAARENELAKGQRQWHMTGLRWTRPVLAERIADRFAQQMADGFLDEVRALQQRYPSALSRTATQALGYRELAAHMRGECTEGEAVAEAIRRTTKFAKRQERWFRRDPRITWIDQPERVPTY